MRSYALVVTPDCARPAGRPDECFYCHAAMGEPHVASCVCITQDTRVKVTVEVEIILSEPASWDGPGIDFHLNESSWCASNAAEKIAEAVLDDDCLCAAAKFEFVARVGEPYVKVGA